MLVLGTQHWDGQTVSCPSGWFCICLRPVSPQLTLDHSLITLGAAPHLLRIWDPQHKSNKGWDSAPAGTPHRHSPWVRPASRGLIHSTLRSESWQWLPPELCPPSPRCDSKGAQEPTSHRGGGSGGYLEHVFRHAARELFGIHVDEVTYRPLR